jgi:hypothetical protein
VRCFDTFRGFCFLTNILFLFILSKSVLSEIWVFWNVIALDDSSGEYSKDVTKQIGSLLNSQTCVNINTNVNASTVILGCFVGLVS